MTTRRLDDLILELRASLTRGEPDAGALTR
jgi:hypothetical protein